MLNSTSLPNAYLHIKKDGLGSSNYGVYTDLIFQKASTGSTNYINFPGKSGTVALTSDIPSGTPETRIITLEVSNGYQQFNVEGAVYVKLTILGSNINNYYPAKLYITTDATIPSSSNYDVKIDEISINHGMCATLEFCYYADNNINIKYDTGSETTGGTMYKSIATSLSVLNFKLDGQEYTDQVHLLYEIIKE